VHNIKHALKIRSVPWLGFLFLLLCFTSQLHAGIKTVAEEQKNAAENAAIRKEWESWNAPFKPLRIIGDVYYVGPSGISSFLITTPKGHIVLDTGFETTVPRIRESVEKLGFRMADIKIILNSHAHCDHAGGHAAMQQLTGAKIMMSEADAALLASGGTNDFTPFSRDMIGYPPAKADRLLRDGDKVELGGTTLTCHLTPGHTKGCTTWTIKVSEKGKTYHVLFFGSTSVLTGVPLLNNEKYPNIAEDLAETYGKLKALPCDIFLAPHAGFFGLKEKAAKLEHGAKENPFVDAREFSNFITKAEEKFQTQLESERSKSHK
jgi:metallo-beta-lactamase class B